MMKENVHVQASNSFRIITLLPRWSHFMLTRAYYANSLYWRRYSTDLFTRKAIEWTTNVTSASKQGKTLLYLAFQAVHGPIEPPSGTYSGCENITEKTR